MHAIRFRQGTQGDANQRADAYLRDLQYTAKETMIPACVAQEVLVGMRPGERPVTLELLSKFRIYPFDQQAAAVAAAIESIVVAGPKLAYIAGVRTDLDKVWGRLDAQVVAVASVNKAEEIVTFNIDQFQRLVAALGPGYSRPRVTTPPQLQPHLPETA